MSILPHSDTSDEIWIPVVGYEDDYMVSNWGQLKRRRDSNARRHYREGMILNPTISKNGYATFVFNHNGNKKRCYVHHIVMAAFVGECPPKHEVNHINGIRADNCLENLEYVTRSQNNLHAYRVLGREATPTYGIKHHCSKLDPKKADEIRILYSRGGITYAELGRQYGVHWTSIRSIIRNETWVIKEGLHVS